MLDLLWSACCSLKGTYMVRSIQIKKRNRSINNHIQYK